MVWLVSAAVQRTSLASVALTHTECGQVHVVGRVWVAALSELFSEFCGGTVSFDHSPGYLVRHLHRSNAWSCGVPRLAFLLSCL